MCSGVILTTRNLIEGAKSDHKMGVRKRTTRGEGDMILCIVYCTEVPSIGAKEEA